MMHLPPQAYTKETLIQAYNWLRSQPAHVQELAKSPDTLVSLYNKSQIHGENYLNRTNLQGFKSELKNLAHIMGDIDGNNINNDSTPSKSNVNTSQSSITAPQTFATPPQANSMHSSAPTQGQSHSSIGQASHGGQNTGKNTTSISPGTNSSSALTPTPSESYLPSLTNAWTSTNPMPPEPQDLRNLIDSRSWGMLQEVKNHLNLSSEAEALRLLISLGYQKIRPQF